MIKFNPIEDYTIDDIKKILERRYKSNYNSIFKIDSLIDVKSLTGIEPKKIYKMNTCEMGGLLCRKSRNII